MPESNPESSAIKYILEEEEAAWNRGDAGGYARHFAPDGILTNIIGVHIKGHQNFLERHKQVLNGVFRNTKLSQEIVSIQFIRPDVALVATLVRLSGFQTNPLLGVHIDEQGYLHTRLLQVMVKNADGWTIMAYHNVDIKPGIPIPEIQVSHKLMDEHNG